MNIYEIQGYLIGSLILFSSVFSYLSLMFGIKLLTRELISFWTIRILYFLLPVLFLSLAATLFVEDLLYFDILEYIESNKVLRRVMETSILLIIGVLINLIYQIVKIAKRSRFEILLFLISIIEENGNTYTRAVLLDSIKFNMYINDEKRASNWLANNGGKEVILHVIKPNDMIFRNSKQIANYYIGKEALSIAQEIDIINNVNKIDTPLSPLEVKKVIEGILKNT